MSNKSKRNQSKGKKAKGANTSGPYSSPSSRNRQTGTGGQSGGGLQTATPVGANTPTITSPLFGDVPILATAIINNMDQSLKDVLQDTGTKPEKSTKSGQTNPKSGTSKTPKNLTVEMNDQPGGHTQRNSNTSCKAIDPAGNRISGTLRHVKNFSGGTRAGVGNLVSSVTGRKTKPSLKIPATKDHTNDHASTPLAGSDSNWMKTPKDETPIKDTKQDPPPTGNGTCKKGVIATRAHLAMQNQEQLVYESLGFISAELTKDYSNQEDFYSVPYSILSAWTPMNKDPGFFWTVGNFDKALAMDIFKELNKPAVGASKK